MGDLSTPLLGETTNPKDFQQIDVEVYHDEVGNVLQEHGARYYDWGKEDKIARDELETRLEHAISVLGEPPALTKRLPIDPFKNKTWEIVGLYNWAKTILFLPVLVVRVLMVLLVLFVGLIATKLALAGYKQADAPLPRWRRRFMFVTRFCGRAIMFSFGFHWINRIGHPAPREVAPIVVSNHVSFIDPIFYFWELLPVLVSSNSHDDIFLVGSIIRAMQVIIVDRFSPESRRHAAIEIKRKALCNDYPRVVLFPEGTTTNGKALISFKLGAFRPGLAVQPVVIRYPFVHCDTSWGNISLVKLILRMLTQVTNHMEVEYLPVIYPSKKEVENAEAFATRVHYTMAAALNIPETEHTYGDLVLAVKYAELNRYEATKTMVEMGIMEKLFHLTTKDVGEYLDKFAKMDTTRSGYVTIDQFLEALDIPRSPFSEKIFLMFDKSEQSYINFREFVTVLGYISNSAEFASLVKVSFQGCDACKDGVLSESELANSMRSVFPEIQQTQVQQMFEKMDLDHDGVITWEEFRTFLEKNPEFLAIFIAASSASHLEIIPSATFTSMEPTATSC